MTYAARHGKSSAMREEKITIRVTEEEKRRLEAEAEAEGRALSDWMRRTLLGGTSKKNLTDGARRRKTGT